MAQEKQNNPITQTFKIERECKNSIRYVCEKSEEEAAAKIIYFNKKFLDCIGRPSKILVTFSSLS